MSADERGADQTMLEDPTPPRRDGKRRPIRVPAAAKAVIVIVAVLVGGVLAVTAGANSPFSAASGKYVHPGDQNASATGTGELIALGAYNDVNVGEKFTHDISFAPGYESWRDKTIAFQTDLQGGAPTGKAYIPSSALRWQVAESAICSWVNDYVASRAAGHAAAAANAATQITSGPNWPAITGLNYPSGLGATIAAVHARDAKLVQALIDTGQGPGNCSAVGPFPPAGMSEKAVRAKLVAASHRGDQELATDPIARKLRITVQ